MDKHRIESCQYCRDKHIKCNGKDPCQNCSKLGRRCFRNKKGYRFGKSTKFKSDLGFSSNQTWMQTDHIDDSSYVDLTDEVSRASGKQKQSASNKNRDPSVDQPEPQTSSTAPSRTLGPTPNASQQQGGDDEESTDVMDILPDTEISTPKGTASSGNLLSPSVLQYHVSPAAGTTRTYGSAMTPRHAFDTAEILDHAPDLSSPITLASPIQHDPLHGLPVASNEAAYLGLQESCLLRHFTNNLAPWLDTTDRDRHYTLVVPQRALYCPVLLYAIFTASGRHLTRLSQKRNPAAVVHFEGIPLPGLDEKTAIHYHNICISCLIAISRDPAQSYNEDALTAATILRFYEQIDTPLIGYDSETYLKIVLTVVNTQDKEDFYSVYTIQGPPRDTDIYAVPATSMRHSACLIALRQEITSVFLYRRPFRLPLDPNHEYVNLPPADDFTWTNRILVWTADVLKFCFGTDRSIASTPGSVSNTHSSRLEHWDLLKKFEHTWATSQPPCFKPIFHRPSDPAANKPFPEYWHTTDCQVIGLQHLELASTLLAVYDPRIPRVGLGAGTAQRRLQAQARQSTLKVCGLALSNQRVCPSAMVPAAIAISIHGENFEDAMEQQALIDFMDKLEAEHAWPTQAAIDALKEAWNS